ncbi:MAG TPA: Zn-ribbon domain-containing OB-fold protein [Chloroflexota bacterium]|nr:Zn-ribbon domain-containing OB-fold protein [Chloroflexota bacterium]
MGLSERIASGDRLRTWEGNFPLEHLYTVGVAGERALRELKDHGRLLGTRCARCEVTYAPARLYCERCLTRLDEWVPIALVGTLASYTMVHQDVDGQLLETPALVGLIGLDDASGHLVHRLGEFDGQQPRLGMKVEAVLRPATERVGSIVDIRYFRPVG